jgi:Mpv17 / PMP22 family
MVKEARCSIFLIVMVVILSTHLVDAFISTKSYQLSGYISSSHASTWSSPSSLAVANLDQRMNRRNRSSQNDKSKVSYEKESLMQDPFLLLASSVRILSKILGDSSSGTPQATTILPLGWILALGLIMSQNYGIQLIQFSSVFFQKLSSFYLSSLVAFPCITKAISAGIIGICGDFMAQQLEFKLHRKTMRESSNLMDMNKFSYDSRRGISIMTGGFFVSGPLMHLGYNCFEHILPVKGTLAAFTHLIADMLILDSVFVAAAFLNTGIMEGYDLRKHIIPQFRRDYTDTLKASWATSIMLMPLGFLCFRFLPVSFRTLAMNFTDVVWDAIVSFMTHRNRHKDDRIM